MTASALGLAALVLLALRSFLINAIGLLEIAFGLREILAPLFIASALLSLHK